MTLPMPPSGGQETGYIPEWLVRIMDQKYGEGNWTKEQLPMAGLGVNWGEIPPTGYYYQNAIGPSLARGAEYAKSTSIPKLKAGIQSGVTGFEELLGGQSETRMADYSAYGGLMPESEKIQLPPVPGESQNQTLPFSNMSPTGIYAPPAVPTGSTPPIISGLGASQAARNARIQEIETWKASRVPGVKRRSPRKVGKKRVR